MLPLPAQQARGGRTKEQKRRAPARGHSFIRGDRAADQKKSPIDLVSNTLFSYSGKSLPNTSTFIDLLAWGGRTKEQKRPGGKRILIKEKLRIYI